MKIKILEKLPELTPPEEDDVVTFKFPETDKISPPLLQLSDVDFGYTKDKLLLKGQHGCWIGREDWVDRRERCRKIDPVRCSATILGSIGLDCVVLDPP